LCELYIGRKFDENDSLALKDFLRDLQVQKPRKVVAKEEKPQTGKFIGVSERKQNLATPASQAPIEIRDIGVAKGGAKERVAAYAQTVSHASDRTSLSAERVQEDLGGGTNVSERKAKWKGISETSPERTPSAVVLLDEHGNPVAPKTKDKMSEYEKAASAKKSDVEIVAQRVAEVKGAPGVKDRLGNWTAVATKTEADNKETVEERVADLKQAPGVKDRLGNWNQMASKTEADKKETVAERLADLQQAPGVKDRLGNWNQVAASTKVASATEERVAELKDAKAPGVKDRLGNYSAVAEKDGTIVSAADPNFAAARTAELQKTSSVRDRMGVYSKATEGRPVEKKQVYIPQDQSELPTRDTQGQ